MQISIRQLKDNLSKYLHLSQQGEMIVVTSHNRPVVRLAPIPVTENAGLQSLLASGLAQWNGQKPALDRQVPRPKIAGKTAAEVVLEERG